MNPFTASHRELYPEQYTHELVGKRVQNSEGKCGTVERVVSSRFGPLAKIDESQIFYALKNLTVL